MRIDLVSIFPDYFAPLQLSLPGKAQRRGLLEVHVHDLRGWTHDRHHTVDDTPYGGGAGMVMKPEPWGEALDELLSAAGPDPVVVVPTPSGAPFTQALAAELAGCEHLVFACGRYEGIDQRVVDHFSERIRVVEVSIGDYVLNGGEVAALAVVEAVVRLLPGFMGNAGSLLEESHASGLLEYPVFTKPARWRGLDVPEVLLSGDHARVASWRHDQSLRRTAQRRPDLLHPAATVTVGGLAEAELRLARRSDGGELMTLQRACWSRASAGAEEVPELLETLDEVTARLEEWTTFVLRSHGRLVGSVRGRLDGEEWQVAGLMVAPDLQGRGVGRWLLARIQDTAPPAAAWLSAVAGADDGDARRLLHRAGFRPARQQPDSRFTRLVKRRR